MKKIAFLLSKGDKMWYDIPQVEQEKFLNSLRDPRDTIDRSWLQYRCQIYFSSTIKILILNLITAFVLPLVILSFYLKRNKFVHKVDAIADLKGFEEILPQEIKKKYTINNNIWEEVDGSLNLSDLRFCFKLVFRYFLSPLFVCKNVLKIAKYSSFISNYTPKAIIVHNEYSYTSSILTAYCRTRNVKHINVMHGEKLYFIRDSFFEYDECYIWGDHYKKLFTDMRAKEKQFIISLPQSLKINVSQYKNDEYFANYKYYLAAYDESQIKNIVDSMQFFKSVGKTVKYRPHPRYSNIGLLNKYVSKDEIEEPKEVSILSSISNTEIAVGCFSTVLLQAYYSGKKVVCDDVTFFHYYSKLKEYRWILSDVETIRLSELQ